MTFSQEDKNSDFNKEELINSLKRMWLEVERVYRGGEICSERHLQAVMYHALMNDISFAEVYGFYIEPYVKPEGKAAYVPDALITKGNVVIAHIEIKYVPHTYPIYEKDLKSFKLSEKLIGERVKFPLNVNPNSGDWNKKKAFQFYKNLLFVYMFIANHKSNYFTELQEFENPIKEKQILQLTGKITSGDSPTIEFYHSLKNV